MTSHRAKPLQTILDQIDKVHTHTADKLAEHVQALDLTDDARHIVIEHLGHLLEETTDPDAVIGAIDELNPTHQSWINILTTQSLNVKIQTDIALYCVYEHSDDLNEAEQQIIQTILVGALTSEQLTGSLLWRVIVELDDMRPWHIDIPAHRWAKAVGSGWLNDTSMIELARSGFEPLIVGLIDDYAFDEVDDEEEVCAALQYFSPQTVLKYITAAQHHEDTNYQHAALSIMCCRMSPSFGPQLIEAFHQTPEMAFALAWGLQKIHQGIPESQAILLEHHVKQLQLYVDGNHDLTLPIHDIGEILTPEAIPHLLPFLHDQRLQYHVATLRALSKLHHPTLIPHHVESITRDEYYECTRFHYLAAYGLAQVDAPNHTQWLLEQLSPPEDAPFNFEDHQFAYIHALQERLDIEACQPLADLLLGQNALGNLTQTLQTTLAMYGGHGWSIIINTLATLAQSTHPNKTQRNQRARGVWQELLTHQLIDLTTHTIERHAAIYADAAQIMQPAPQPEASTSPTPTSSKAADDIIAKTKVAFESGDEALYQRCCEEIKTHHITQASETLVAHLEGADDERLLILIPILGALRAVVAIPTIEAIFERMPVYAHSELKFCAAEALMSIDPNNTASHDFLLSMLREQYWGDRCDAAKLLNRSTAPINDRYMRILTALEDESDLDPMIDILTLSGRTCSNHAHIELVESESWRCREQAAKNIASAPENNPLIVHRLSLAFQRERHPLVRRAIAQALGAHDHPYPIEAITQAMTNDPDPQVRQALTKMFEHR